MLEIRMNEPTLGVAWGKVPDSLESTREKYIIY